MYELHCQFEVVDWNENKLWTTDDGSSASVVEARYQYSGDISGNSRINMQLIYHAQGDSDFVALEHISATIAGKQGGLILRHQGVHHEHAAQGLCEIVHATGALEGMLGQGEYRAESQKVGLILKVIDQESL